MEFVDGADGTVQTRCRENCGRDLMTEFGEVVVGRKGCSAKGVGSLFPLDGEFNLPSNKYSSNLCRLLAEAVADRSFDEVVEMVRTTTGGSISKRQIIEQAVKATLDFDAFYALPGSLEESSDLLVITVDGKGIVMRREDLRPATRRAAEEQSEVAGSRLTPGETQPQAHGHGGGRLHSGGSGAHPRAHYGTQRKEASPCASPKQGGLGQHRAR